MKVFCPPSVTWQTFYNELLYHNKKAVLGALVNLSKHPLNQLKTICMYTVFPHIQGCTKGQKSGGAGSSVAILLDSTRSAEILS